MQNRNPNMRNIFLSPKKEVFSSLVSTDLKYKLIRDCQNLFF